MCMSACLCLCVYVGVIVYVCLCVLLRYNGYSVPACNKLNKIIGWPKIASRTDYAFSNIDSDFTVKVYTAEVKMGAQFISLDSVKHSIINSFVMLPSSYIGLS